MLMISLEGDQDYMIDEDQQKKDKIGDPGKNPKSLTFSKKSCNASNRAQSPEKKSQIVNINFSKAIDE